MTGLLRTIHVPRLLALLTVLTAFSVVQAQDSLGIRILEGERSLDGFTHVALGEEVSYIAAGASGLLVAEQTGAGYEVVEQLAEGDEWLTGVWLDNNDLLAIGAKYIRRYDISNPQDPQLEYQYTYEDNWPFFYHTETTFYRDSLLITMSYHLTIQQLPASGAPVLLDSLTWWHTEWVSNAAVAGDRLYVTTKDTSGAERFKIYDFSDPQNIQLVVDSGPMELPFSDLCVRDTLLLATTPEGLHLYDISPDGSLELLDAWTDDTVPFQGAYSPMLIGDHALFYQYFSNHFYTFTLTPELELVLQDSIPHPNAYFQRSACSEEAAAFAINELGLLTISFDDNHPAGEFSTFDPVTWYFNWAQLGDVILVDGNREPFRVYQHSTPDELAFLGELEHVEGWRSSLNASGQDIALLRWSDGTGGEGVEEWQAQLATYDESEPLHIALRGLFTAYEHGHVFGQEGWIFGFDWDEHPDSLMLRVYNITDIDAPFLATEVMMENCSFEFVEYSDSCLYLERHYDNLPNGDLCIIDVRNPMEPVQTIFDLDDVRFDGLYVESPYLFIQQRRRTDVYSIENPLQPALVDTFTSDNMVSMKDYNDPLMLGRRHYYTPDWSNRLEIYSFDTDDPHLPELLYYYHFPRGVFNPTFLEEDRLFTTWGSGMGLFEYGEVSVAEAPSLTLPGEPEVTAYPNPANPVTQVQLRLPQAGPVNITVFDVLGREVATLHEGRLTAGLHTFAFGGQAHTASGVYFVQVTAGQWRDTRRVVLLK